MSRPRRCKILILSPQQISRLLTSLAGQSYPMKITGWPEDAEVLWPFIDFEHGTLGLVVASDSFPEVEENAAMERFRIEEVMFLSAADTAEAMATRGNDR